MSGLQESLLSRLYAGASEQRPHGDYYSYSVYFCTTIQPNTNTLFGLLFGLNRIRIEYSVQLYLHVYCDTVTWWRKEHVYCPSTTL